MWHNSLHHSQSCFESKNSIPIYLAGRSQLNPSQFGLIYAKAPMLLGTYQISAIKMHLNNQFGDDFCFNFVCQRRAKQLLLAGLVRSMVDGIGSSWAHWPAHIHLATMYRDINISYIKCNVLCIYIKPSTVEGFFCLFDVHPNSFHTHQNQYSKPWIETNLKIKKNISCLC